jgi:hypothetical protein
MCIILSLFLIFPAFGNMLESQSLDLWNQKVASMGILYTVGSLFWSFSALIILSFFLGVGVIVIRRKESSTPD